MTLRFAAALGAVLMLVLAAGPGSVGPTEARAQTETMSDPTIAVIDMRRIRQQSDAVKSIEQQIQKRKSRYQEKLSEKEKALREEDKSLAKQRTLLSEEAFKKKRQQLKQKLGAFRRQIKTRRKALDQAYSEAMRKVQKKLIEIVQTVAKERELDVVLNKGAVVLVRPDMEITEVALERLNSQLGSVDVPDLNQ